MSYRSSTINISGGSPGSFTTLTVTGVASFADGTAAAPSVKIGDEQNGLYSPSAGVLGLAANGLLTLTMEAAASSTNYWAIFASAAGTRPSLRARSTTAVSANIQNGAAAPIVFSTDADGTAREVLRLLHNTGANYLTIQNGTSPIIGTSAGDLSFAPGGSESLRAVAVASAVNYWSVSGATTATGVQIDATGSDSGVNGFLVTKGSGVWNFCTGGSSSNRQFQVGHVANAVNYLAVGGGATGNPIGLTATGSDTNVAIQLSGKGTGTVYTVVRGAASLEATNPASAVNYFQVSGSATGSAVSASAAGADTNIDIAITPKGTGVLRYGTHSAVGVELVTGYITIKDAAGNSRKLAVIS